MIKTGKAAGPGDRGGPFQAESVRAMRMYSPEEKTGPDECPMIVSARIPG
jgi:hypothetical protein